MREPREREKSPINHFQRKIIDGGIIGINDLQYAEERKQVEAESLSVLQTQIDSNKERITK